MRKEANVWKIPRVEEKGEKRTSRGEKREEIQFKEVGGGEEEKEMRRGIERKTMVSR